MPREIKTIYLILTICCALAATTLAVFMQVGNHEFISFDDNDYVTENHYVQGGLAVKGIVWAFSEAHANNWHPLTWLSHMLDYQIFGLQAGGHHMINLLFHVANSILLFLLLFRMTRNLWQSAFVAGLFALHPLHVESVAWVAERKDVLSTFFWMLTIGAYSYYVDRRNYKRYLLVLAFFVLGLMSKPMLVTLPFVLLLLDFWPLKRLQALQLDTKNNALSLQPAHHGKKKTKSREFIRKEILENNRTMGIWSAWKNVMPLLVEKIPLIAIAIVVCFLTVYAQQRVIKPMELYPFDGRLANALISYAAYIGKMLWPVKLSIFYPYTRTALLSWQTASAIFLLIVITYLAIRALKRFPYLIVGWLWYLGTLVPAIGLIQVGLQSRADRYTYVPLIGIFIMIAWGVPEILGHGRHRRFALSAASSGIILALAVATYVQVGFWRNSIILYEHAIDVTSANSWAENNLGYVLYLKGKTADAIIHYKKAISIDDPAEAHYNLGTVLAKQGRLDEAIYQFRASIRISPRYAKAYNNMGNAFLYQGRLDEAIACYREALRLNREYVDALRNLKIALAVQERLRRS
jgi:protein O-mannosyl-transferase